MIRRFWLQRNEDSTGISGVGKVAEGVQYTNGWCSVMWITDVWSMVTYPDIESVEKIHGHGGKTEIVWQDPDPTE